VAIVPAARLAAGNFVNPTLFADVDNGMKIAREEIFGPVLSMIPFRDEEHAVALANDTDYGLGASVQTLDIKRALRVAKAVRRSFGVNGYGDAERTVRGLQDLRHRARGGREGIGAFLETKTVTIALGDAMI
jgi:aldehyde dehydrogenase (NAD+)